MPLKVTCSNCNSAFSVKDEFIGKKGKCPKCGSIIEINKSVEQIESNKKTKKKKESRLGFALLLGLAIGAFFLTGLSPGFFVVAGGALFLFVYDLYKKKK